VVHLLLHLALLAMGMAAGGLMIAVLGGAPLQFVLPVEQYIPVQQFLTTRFDPFMPICLVTTILTDVGLAFSAPTATSRLLTGISAALVASAISVSLTKNYPINKWVRSLDPDAVPENWAEVDPRVRWRNWNAVRASLTITGLLVNLAAAGSLF
jgi:hypothetical protein